MATLIQRRNKWYSRIQWRENGRVKEKQISLRTTNKISAYKRKSIVEEYEEDIKGGLAFDFPWLNGGGKTKVKERTVSETVEEYLAVRRIEGIRESTIARIECAMKSVYSLIGEKAQLDSFDENTILRYKRHCREVCELKPNTININLSKIKALLNWCFRKKYIKEIPYIEMVKVEITEVDYLSDAMFIDLLKFDKIDNHYKRTFAFYVETGCRLFEPFDGYIKGNTLIIPPTNSKTHRKRTVVLNPLTLAILKEMRNNVSKCSGNRKFAIKNYSRVFKKAVRDSGLPDRYHFHNLRDTYAVRRWAVTGDIYLVSKEIGHTSVTTTEKYADFELESLLVDFPTLEKWITPRLVKPSLDESFLEAINPQLIAL